MLLEIPSLVNERDELSFELSLFLLVKEDSFTGTFWSSFFEGVTEVVFIKFSDDF